MRCETRSEVDDRLLRTEEAVPVCGEDFCDSCGDCLACYGGDYCPERPEHRWIVYEAD
jgi:hypothetical protein